MKIKTVEIDGVIYMKKENVLKLLRDNGINFEELGNKIEIFVSLGVDE